MQMIMFFVESSNGATHVTRTRATRQMARSLAHTAEAQVMLIDRPMRGGGAGGAVMAEASLRRLAITDVSRDVSFSRSTADYDAAERTRLLIAREEEERAEQDAERWDGLY